MPLVRQTAQPATAMKQSSFFGESFLCTRCFELRAGFDSCAICGAELDAVGGSGIYVRCELCSSQDVEDSY